jgi:C4-dicarboxylate transporter DctM subunit
MTIAFLFSAFFALLLLGVPVAIGLGLSSVLAIFFFGHESMAALAAKFFQTANISALLCVPFFILASNLMTSGGVARRMIDFTIAAVGHLRGGLAIASVMACMLFAAVSGSSPATVIAVGSIIITGMVEAGYSKRFAAGVICNAGTLGILVPPSLILVVYGAATDTSVGRLFMGGILPGIVLGLMLMGAIYAAAWKLDLPRQKRASFRDLFSAARRAAWGLLLIFIILGGIYGGVFTPTEAASVAVVYAAAIALFVHRDLALRDLPRVIVQSGRTTVMLMFIISNAMLFAYVLTTLQIPQTAAQQVLNSGMSHWMFLLIVNLVLLLAGNFMDPSSIVLILAPIVFPIATRMGIDPVHLGIIMAVNMEIGLVHPPVGLNLFVMSGVANMQLGDVVKAALPWLAVLLVFLGIVTYVPILSTTLPDLVLGRSF